MLVIEEKLGGAGGYSLPSGSSQWEYVKFPASVFGCTNDSQVRIEHVYTGAGIFIERTLSDGSKDFWGASDSSNVMGLPNVNNSQIEHYTMPSAMFANSDTFKEVHVGQGNIYILMNSGKVWALGAVQGLGKGSDYPDAATSFICITADEDNPVGLPLINSLHSLEKDYLNLSTLKRFIPPLFSTSTGEVYTVRYADVMFRNNVLEYNWRIINPTEDGKIIKIRDFKEGIMIDVNNNLWVCGGNSKYLGLGATNSRTIRVYEKVTNNKINGKVKEAYKDSYSFAVVTTDGKLFVIGDWKNANLGQTCCFTGWEESVGNVYEFREITNSYFTANDLVVKFSYETRGRMMITKNSSNDTYKFILWGQLFDATDQKTFYTPITYDLPIDVSTNLPISPSTIKSMRPGYYHGFFITNEGALYAAGLRKNVLGMDPSSSFVIHPYFKNMKIVDLQQWDKNCIVLDSLGNLYGWGQKNQIGLGSDTTTFDDPTTLGIENVSQFAMGSNYCVVVKNDGTVWGTGNNTNGILGRWKGADRKISNSRYKTAFSWVECPELEN